MEPRPRIITRRRAASASAAEVLDLLRRYECRNITFIEPDGSWPIVWERAKGVHVWDIDGRRYLDLTAAFGVAAAGHANPRVVKAGQRQMAKLLHAMGDVHPHALKGQLARELSRITFERWSRVKPDSGRAPELGSRKSRPTDPRVTGKTIFCNSGFEAVEAALKTAMLATGRRGVIAFQGGYHGLGYGALAVTHRDYFRRPFLPQVREFGHFVPFPTDRTELPQVEKLIARLFRQESIGAILVEPVQGRGGIHIPPAEFLPLLRRLCDRHQALLVLDEVFTGFGRTGKWFACEHTATIPDLICLGKALTGGFPLSACVGRAELMDVAWPEAQGEAIHTSTYLGHPVGCAMALAQIEEIRQTGLVERSAAHGRFLLRELLKLQAPEGVAVTVRGLGLMVGIELRHSDHAPATSLALKAVQAMLQRGFIVLPEGEHAQVIALCPPLTISAAQLGAVARELNKAFRELGNSGT